MVVVVAPEPQHRAGTVAVATEVVLALFLKITGDLRGDGELQPLGPPAGSD